MKYCLVSSESGDWFVVPEDKYTECRSDNSDEWEFEDWAVYTELHQLRFSEWGRVV